MTASPLKSSLLRKVCGAAIAIAIISFSCLGQVIDSQDDSLLLDEFHAVKPVTADTLHQHRIITRPVLADTVPRQQDTSKISMADTMHQQQETGKPVAADTVPQQRDTVKPEIIEPAHPRYTEEAPVAPAVRDLSPFSSDRMHCLGLSLDYFSYAELTGLSDVFPGYPVGYPPNYVIGAPKSTEYGLMFGFNYQGALRQHGSPILFRPDLEIQIGIHQTYDGSTQGLPISGSNNDTVGWEFLPIKDYKSNYFVQAGVDVGYCLTHAIVPFYIYSGIKGKLWYRDLLPDTTSYANQITDAEVYYWFEIPAGLSMSMPVSPNLALGVDVSCDLMFKGYMQVLFSEWDAVNTDKTVSPVVTLGNRVGYHVEFPIVYKSANENIFRFTPYLTIYSFGQSEYETSQKYHNGVYLGPDKDVVFNEPASASWLLGARFQVVFLSPYTRTR